MTVRGHVLAHRGFSLSRSFRPSTIMLKPSGEVLELVAGAARRRRARTPAARALQRRVDSREGARHQRGEARADEHRDASPRSRARRCANARFLRTIVCTSVTSSAVTMPRPSDRRARRSGAAPRLLADLDRCRPRRATSRRRSGNRGSRDALVVARDRDADAQLDRGVRHVRVVERHAHDDRADVRDRLARSTTAGAASVASLAAVRRGRARTRAADARQWRGGSVAPDLRDEVAVARRRAARRCRVDGEEEARLLCARRRVVGGDGVAPASRASTRAASDTSSEIVVELGGERLLRVAHAVVDLVEHLPVQEPRQDRQRREHHDDRERDERRQLRFDQSQSREHLAIGEGNSPSADHVRAIGRAGRVRSRHGFDESSRPSRISSMTSSLTRSSYAGSDGAGARGLRRA